MFTSPRRYPFLAAAILALGLTSWASAPTPQSGTQTVPAYFRGTLFTVNLSDPVNKYDEDILVSDGRINRVFISSQARAAGTNFIDVVDALQGEGSNPIWQVVEVNFLTIPPQQYTSDLDIEAASNAGQIALSPTLDVYNLSSAAVKK